MQSQITNLKSSIRPAPSPESLSSPAQADLLAYVRENWDSRVGDDLPEDDDELIEQYFDCVHEEYDIAETA